MDDGRSTTDGIITELLVRVTSYVTQEEKVSYVVILGSGIDLIKF